MPEEEGKRFSLVYLNHNTPLKDSERFRNRLEAYYLKEFHDHFDVNIQTALRLEVGIEIPIGPFGHYLTHWVFAKCELRDVLDSITIIYQVLLSERNNTAAKNWKAFVDRTLCEENVGYRLDEQCGVRYFVDEEFERNRNSTLFVLDKPRYVGVNAAFDDAYRHMDSDPQDTKASVRSMFESLEILVKLMIPSASRLNKIVINGLLKEKCLSLYQDDPVARKVVEGLLESFAQMVDAMHNYRHGQATEEPVMPSEELTIHILSTGCSYLRWLAQVDASILKGQAAP